MTPSMKVRQTTSPAGDAHSVGLISGAGTRLMGLQGNTSLLSREGSGSAAIPPANPCSSTAARSPANPCSSTAARLLELNGGLSSS